MGGAFSLPRVAPGVFPIVLTREPAAPARQATAAERATLSRQGVAGGGIVPLIKASEVRAATPALL